MSGKFKIIILVVVGVLVMVCSFGGGFVAGQFIPNTRSQTATPDILETADDIVDNGSTPEDLDTLFVPFWEAWDLVHEHYVDLPLDDSALLEGAIDGMLSAVGDKYTGYLNPQETFDVNTSFEGEYDGIGAWVDILGDYLTIVTPMPDSPAEEAGLQPGDQIIGVDGQDITGIHPDVVRLTMVMGPAGTPVVLTILREGDDEPFDVEITRARIVVPSVTSEILEGNIGYLQLTIFGWDTGEELHNELADLIDQQVEGIILDLRYNGGGSTVAATAVASEFISDGVIWYEQYGDGSRLENVSFGDGLATDLPLVVLVNESSASASELVAGAIQDYERGQLVGVTTFGKGLVQVWYPVSNDGTVTVTVARWFTPNGRSIHGEGLIPDVVVPMTEEDFEAGRDPQLDKAIQVLQLIVSGSSSE